MNKKITLFCICILAIFLVKTKAQELNKHAVEVDVFLSKAILIDASMDTNFINSIDYTIGDFLLLASSNQFYILGIGGFTPLFNTTNKNIDAFTVNSKGTLFVICGKELCILDTFEMLTKLLPLPNNAMGITSGDGCLYVFDKDNPNGENSIYLIFENDKVAKLITLPTPITSLFENKQNLFYSSKNKLFCLDIKTKKLTELYSSTDGEEIISIANDSLKQALYFSTDKTIYRIFNNEIEIVTPDFNGLLKYDGKGLLIFNPEKSLIVRFRNNCLYPSKKN